MLERELTAQLRLQREAWPIFAHAHWPSIPIRRYAPGVCTLVLFINPRRACAARVTVVVLRVCVCLSIKSHLTYEVYVCPENAVTYSAGNEGQKNCGDLPETTAFKSYAAKHERESQYANYSDLPAVSFLRLTHSEAPEASD